ncbi:MAG: hypothetical protein P8M22_11890 [Phycisphaerales bacterium]|nr:hypothetical protein [Phycisphaerales bacterium]
MTIKAKSHRTVHFIAWFLLLLSMTFWVLFFMVQGDQLSQDMWWPSMLVATISSILFGLIFFKGLFD